jgi:hypothetical protein
VSMRCERRSDHVRKVERISRAHSKANLKHTTHSLRETVSKQLRIATSCMCSLQYTAYRDQTKGFVDALDLFRRLSTDALQLHPSCSVLSLVWLLSSSPCRNGMIHRGHRRPSSIRLHHRALRSSSGMFWYCSFASWIYAR